MKFIGAASDAGCYVWGMTMPKLMNVDEEVPFEFFIFVNRLNPVTYHNFNLIGQFSSGAFSSTSLGAEYLQKYLKNNCV